MTPPGSGHAGIAGGNPRKQMYRGLSGLLFCLLALSGRAQEFIPLYPGAIPGSKEVADEEQVLPNELVDTIVLKVSRPELGVFLPPPAKALLPAVIVCPGGGYHAELIRREGSQVAEAFRKAGVAAFVLKYRLPDDRIAEKRSVVPLQDLQQAIKLLRQRAREWGIDPARIGVMGFSAGGHLAASAGVHFNESYIGDTEGISLRPDFMLLINPVISFTDSIGHLGSRQNLLGPVAAELGPVAAEEQIRFFSNELGVGPRTPPAFLVHAAGDSVVLVKNSLYFYQALRREGISAELHLYSRGEHGFLSAPPFEEWFGRCLYWMRAEGWIRPGGE